MFIHSEYFKGSDKKTIIHDNIINNITELINNLPLNNIHEKFYIFCYLLHNGFLSIDKSYTYNNSTPLDEVNTIFLGNGCCRHNSNLLNEVLRNLNINSISMPITLIKAKFTDINKKKRIYSIQKKENLNEYNHRICIASSIEKNNSLFILEPTGLSEFEIIKNNKIICYNGTFKVNNTLFKRDLKHSYISKYISNKKTLNASILNNFYEYAKEVCNTNKKLFDDFYVDNHSNYENIKSLILKKY